MRFLACCIALFMFPFLLVSQELAIAEGGEPRKEQLKQLKQLTIEAKKWNLLDLDSSLVKAQAAINLASELNDKKCLIDNLILLGTIFTQLKEYTAALEVLERVRHLKEELTNIDLPIEVDIANATGTVHRESDDLTKALFYHEQALAYAEQLDQPEKLATTLVSLGKTYRIQGQDSLALTTQLRAQNMEHIAGITGHLSDCLVELGLLHEQMGNIDMAFDYFNQALDQEESKGNQKKIARTLNTLATAYAKTKNAHSSIGNSEKALALASANNDYASASDACINLAACYRALKSYEKSLEFENLADTYKNKLLKLERKRLVTTMKANFILTKKESENKYLREREKMLEGNIKRQMVTIIFFCLALLFASALAAFMYSFNEAKKKNNEILQQRNNAIQQQNDAIQQQKKKLEEVVLQLKATQSQLVQSEKMASLGQLTAGVAHEINNPVNFIYSGVAGLKKNLGAMFKIVDAYDEIATKDAFETKIQEIQAFKKEIDYEEVRADISGLMKSIEDGAERTGDIVKGLRTFSRIDTSGLHKTNVHENFDSTLIILNNTIRDQIIIEKKYDPTLPEIDTFNGQLNQVFMNILTNAVQAIGEQKGTITIETQAMGDQVQVQISDTGGGMSEETMEHIFEPFYTTKEVGKGTGLGLSISYGIIKEHNGRIEVNSTLNKGTTFTITLPVKLNRV